jgi:hypothetical protein
MKLKLSAALVAGAFAGLAATSAQAGVLQASFKVFAAEVFGAAAVALQAPTAAYNLSRPLSGTPANPNNFTVEFRLSSGAWVTAPDAELRDVFGGNPIPGTLTGISADGRTATYAFTVDNNITYPVNSTITFGTSGNEGSVNGVSAVLATPMNDACNPQQAQIDVSIKLTNASGVEFDTNDPGSDTTETLFASNVALRANGTASSSFAPTPERSVVDVLIPSLGRSFTNPADITNSTAVINIGSINLADRGSFFDIDGLAFHSFANGFGAVTGQVNASNLTLTIEGQLNATGTLGLFTDLACTTPVLGATTVSYNAPRNLTTIVYTPVAADLGFTGITPDSGRVYACYSVLGTLIIPTTQFSLTGAALNKVAGSNEIADPVCPSTLYNLRANGVQIDVRNWIHPAQAAASGWDSVLRLINPSDTQTITVTGQSIAADGTLGATGVIATLAPREARYFTSAQIGALLTTGALPAASGDNARLRLTANGPSLRAQNYVFNPANGNFIEASSAQGDDGFVDPTVNSQRGDIPAQNNK